MNARAVVVVLATAVTTTLPALAGPNDFFGGNVGGANESAQGAQTLQAPPTSAPGGDYTVDEKRMQKKFKANVKDAMALIAKAEAMMKSSDTKLAKKGKIMKEIGEKRLAELRANNPFPEIAGNGNRTK